MNAPAAVPAPTLAERILEAIAKATSKRPASAADVHALVGGEAAAYWAALEQLTRERRINSAHLQRPATDPAPWLGIWPTGVCLPRPPLSGASFSGLFVKHRPGDLRDAHAPRSAPQPSSPPSSEGAPLVNASTPKSPAAPGAGKTRTRASAERRRAQIVQMLAGRSAAQGLPLAEVAARLGLTVAGANYLLEAMVDAGQCGKVRLPGERHCRLYDLHAAAAPAAGSATNAATSDAASSDAATTDPTTAAPAAQADAPVDLGPVGDEIAAWAAALEPEPEPTPPPMAPTMAPAAATIEFALWDDGRLSIYDGDTLTQLPPCDTARLARLLGVPADICFPLQGA